MRDADLNGEDGTIKPGARQEAVVLTDATFAFAQHVKAAAPGLLVGEATGGNQRGKSCCD